MKLMKTLLWIILMMKRWMTKEMSSKMMLNLLSVFPQIHFLSITEDMFAGRAK